MKNKKTLLILIIILVVIAVLSALLFYSKNNDLSTYENELNDTEKRLLVESAYQNFAWGWSYSGAAIFNDGCIYTWNNHNTEGGFLGETNEALSNWILTNGTKQDLKVTTDDLSKIENYMKDLENNLTTPADAIPMNDAGSNYVKVWDEDTTFILTQTGDNPLENSTSQAQSIYSIVTPYFDQVKD